MKKTFLQTMRELMQTLPLTSRRWAKWLVKMEEKYMPDEEFDEWMEYKRKVVPELELLHQETVRSTDKELVIDFPAEEQRVMRLRYLQERIVSLQETLKVYWTNVSESDLMADYWQDKTEKVAKELRGFRLELQFLENREEYKKFPREMIEQAASRDIPEVLGLKTKKIGGTWKINCVFHPDKTPSLVFFQGKGFYCFGCGKNGNAIDYLRKKEGMSFVEAVKFLLS